MKRSIVLMSAFLVAYLSNPSFCQGDQRSNDYFDKVEKKSFESQEKNATAQKNTANQGQNGADQEKNGAYRRKETTHARGEIKTPSTA